MSTNILFKNNPLNKIIIFTLVGTESLIVTVNLTSAVFPTIPFMDSAEQDDSVFFYIVVLVK
jgi:energy-converting hydrogenase Eha subunit C